MISSTQTPPFLVAALYRFCRLDAFESLRAPLAAFCCGRGIKGTLLLAREGINGTVAGRDDDIAALIHWLEAVPELAGLDVKYSTAAGMPFHRMKVKLKREIVTMGVDWVDPLENAGTYVAPADWNALIADPETIVIDTRNDYEVRIGSFAGAIDPNTRTFSEFPAWVAAHRAELADRKVAMFCTGGIRCEKSTNYLLGQGVNQVYHLKGGILKYLEDVPETDSLWQGQCFVFDDRVSVGHGLQPGGLKVCGACRRPVTVEDQAAAVYEEGVCCRACVEEYSAADRERFRERHRQMMLAEKRGALHLGYSLE